MTVDLSGFNPDEYEDMRTFDPIPEGKYLVSITSSSEEPCKGGEQLVFTFQVLEGDYKGRQVWSRLNMVNKNKTTVRIARQELATICRAVNVHPRTTADLHNIPLLAQVVIEKRKDTGGLTNRIRNYYRKDEPQPTSAGEPAADGDKAPWE